MESKKLDLSNCDNEEQTETALIDVAKNLICMMKKADKYDLLVDTIISRIKTYKRDLRKRPKPNQVNRKVLRGKINLCIELLSILGLTVVGEDYGTSNSK